jgi:hypothetical protein
VVTRAAWFVMRLVLVAELVLVSSILIAPPSAPADGRTAWAVVLGLAALVVWWFGSRRLTATSGGGQR